MNIKVLERTTKDMHEGKHLRGLLTEFLQRNNLQPPQTILPVRNGSRITIHGRDYREVTELLLSWNGEETAKLRVQHQTGSFMEKYPQPKEIYVCGKDFERVFVPPKDDSFRASFAHQDTYSLQGIVNGENVSLTTMIWEGNTTTLYTDYRKPHSQEHPRRITRLDNSKYWFIIPAA